MPERDLHHCETQQNSSRHSWAALTSHCRAGASHSTRLGRCQETERGGKPGTLDLWTWEKASRSILCYGPGWRISRDMLLPGTRVVIRVCPMDLAEQTCQGTPAPPFRSPCPNAPGSRRLLSPKSSNTGASFRAHRGRMNEGFPRRQDRNLQSAGMARRTSFSFSRNQAQRFGVFVRTSRGEVGKDMCVTLMGLITLRVQWR